MNTQELTIQKRTIIGRQIESVRRAGFVPGVMYGHQFESTAIQIPSKDFEHMYGAAGESTVVYASLDGKRYPVLIKDVARDPVSDGILHVDLYKVNLSEKLSAAVPLEFEGEAPAVADLGGILVKNISELQVEGYPQDLPHQISVDLAKLDTIGSQILVKDLAVSSKLTILTDPESVVALIQEPAPEEVIEAAPTTIEDVEIIKKEEKTEEESAEAPTEE